MTVRRLIWLILGVVAATPASPGTIAENAFAPVGHPEMFAPGIASTRYAEIRLTMSPDGNTALWFSRDRPGGAGGYDIWLSRRTRTGWSRAKPVAFNTAAREFDPAFTADGRWVYFCSDRPGGRGGDDLYRVAVTRHGFDEPEHLGHSVNSANDEFAPMLSRDGQTLLFSSDRPAGSGGHDLYLASAEGRGFRHARRLSGQLNTGAHEFDATFLKDGRSILFARTPDFANGRVDMFVARLGRDGYGSGERLGEPINHASHNTYGAMLDWSDAGRLLFSARRQETGSMDLYMVRYELR